MEEVFEEDSSLDSICKVNDMVIFVVLNDFSCCTHRRTTISETTKNNKPRSKMSKKLDQQRVTELMNWIESVIEEQ